MTIEVRPLAEACQLKCDYCLPAGTPVLLGNGQWKAIEEIKVGENIVGFDEFRPGEKKHQKYHPAQVTHVMNRVIDGFKVTLDKTSFVASGDHMWLTPDGRWRKTKDFQVGQKIRWVTLPVLPPEFDIDYMKGYFTGISTGDAQIGSFLCDGYMKRKYRLALKDTALLDRTEYFAEQLGINLYRSEVQVGITCEALLTSDGEVYKKILEIISEEIDSDSYKKGYLAGIFDAEGSSHRSKYIRIANQNLAIIERAAHYLDDLGFEVMIEPPIKNGTRNVRILGGLDTVFQFFGQVVPASQDKLSYEGVALNQGSAVIQSIEPVEAQTMYDLTTSTSTFVAAGLATHNCYQEPVREAKNIKAKYDMDEMKRQIDLIKPHSNSLNLFGGEILLMKEKDLEELFKYGYEAFGNCSIQTNGALINDNHIRMFKEYNVTVGFSVDGPNELNDLRKHRGNPKKTRQSTQATMDNILKVQQNGIHAAVIITIHRENATPERLPRLINFIRWLGDIGINEGNIHTLERESTMSTQDYVLTPEENVWAFTELAKFHEANPDLNWNPFRDIKKVIFNEDDTNVLCYWKKCDPLNTQAVYGIEGDGAISNCGRAYKEGINWTKASDTFYGRYISFYYTPQDMGGCQGCRFWSICGGSCPGESMKGDYRNKTEHCSTQKAMLGMYEDMAIEQGIKPWTLSERLPLIQKIIVESIEQGQDIANKAVIDMLNQDRKEFITVPVLEADEGEVSL